MVSRTELTKGILNVVGLCCSKRCAAKVHERSKPGYNPSTVKANNYRRANWTEFYENEDSKAIEAMGMDFLLECGCHD